MAASIDAFSVSTKQRLCKLLEKVQQRLSTCLKMICVNIDMDKRINDCFQGMQFLLQALNADASYGKLKICVGNLCSLLISKEDKKTE